jgi:hypothetical protein
MTARKICTPSISDPHHDSIADQAGQVHGREVYVSFRRGLRRSSPSKVFRDVSPDPLCKTDCKRDQGGELELRIDLFKYLAARLIVHLCLLNR